MSRFRKLEENVQMWAMHKDIFDKASALDQVYKTQEEVGELIAAVARGERFAIEDGIGDILVTLIIQAKMQDMDLLDCLDRAYNVIKDRTGEMRNGKFVRD